MCKNRCRNFLWLLLSVAVATNVAFLLVASRQSKSTHLILNQSHSLLDQVNHTFIDLRAAQQAKRAAIRFTDARLVKDLQRLWPMLPPAQFNSLYALDHLQNMSGNSLRRYMHAHDETISNELRQVRKANLEGLFSTLRREHRENSTIRDALILLSVISFLILFFLGGLWTLDSRTQRKKEVELRETICAINRAKLELEHLNQAKTNLIKSTVHDLRNPIGSIQGFAEIIASQPESHRAIQEISEHIKRISGQMLNLVNSLLDSTALDRGTRQVLLKPVDLTTCLRQTVNSLQPQAQRKKQTIYTSVTDQPITIRGDAHALVDLFINLVGNAIKFSPSEAGIFVRCRLGGSVVRVEVEDQGPGLNTDDKAMAFQKYRKLSAQPTGGENSTGLGLALVKEAVDLHGGRVWIEDSKMGRGALFVVEFPVFGASSSDGMRKDPPGGLSVVHT